MHYLQHSDAEEIAKTLTSAGRRPQQARAGEGRQRRPAAAGGDAVFEGKVAITAHKPSNSLVITSSLHDYARAAARDRPARHASAARCSSRP